MMLMLTHLCHSQVFLYSETKQIKQQHPPRHWSFLFKQKGVHFRSNLPEGSKLIAGKFTHSRFPVELLQNVHASFTARCQEQGFSELGLTLLPALIQ